MNNVIPLNRARALLDTKTSEQRVTDFRFNLELLLHDYSDLSQEALINELTAGLMVVEQGIYGRRK